MNKAILNFYENFGLSVIKIIERRMPKTLSKTRVEVAMEEMYRKIKAGEKIKPINIPREIWRMAEKSKGIEYIKKVKEMEDFKKNFEKYHGEFKRLKIYFIILILLGLMYALFSFK